MFDRSELGTFAALVPCDRHGQVPEPGDDWRSMDWGLADLDCCDADVAELLDDVWWPQVVELAVRIRATIRTMPSAERAGSHHAR